MYISSLITVVVALPAALAVVLPNKVGRLPALGWNNFNGFHDAYSDAIVVKQAKAIISLGLKDVGYQYINIDDTWMVSTGRDKNTHELVVNATKFPRGFGGFAKEIHSLGFLVGIYGDAGSQTCRRYRESGSLGSEVLDAKQFARFKVDYLKYDNCNIPASYNDQYNYCEPDTHNSGNYGNHPNGTCPGLKNLAPKGYDWKTSNSFKRYNAMAKALAAQDRVIQFAICNHGHQAVTLWGPSIASSWRISNDIEPYWYRIAQILNVNSFKLNTVDFYNHNDMDMLEVGNGNLTKAESRSHFAFWAAAKSPLIISTDLTVLDKYLVSVIGNNYLVAFNQDDVYGKPATPFKWGKNRNWTFDPKYPAEFWSGRSKAGTLVLALNSESKTAVRKVTWGEVPGLKAQSYVAIDVWTRRSIGCISGFSATLRTHDTAVLLVGAPCTNSKGIFPLVSATFDG